ncbi:GNAT family N-acetyltransferase [Deinococcus soli (ex Cha et al. 2016)]|uniref:GNAT family N-acetyltransferase n=1 Tax=Deinococcus soli (ex Cha et al. 2016) TaxID=1309411 RepID=UPI001665B30E|nr:GNAT family protein [Deinococcus soli (ex Cha et al. 2016)]GGB78231.1 N-acetyltransferase [Deinococcus soli (ex Cha et al. 2016)]
MRHDLTLVDGPYSLRPLTDADIAPLLALAAAHETEYARMGTFPNQERYYTGALEADDQMPFVKLVRGELAGATRFMEMRPKQRRLEIGSTWLAPAFMRTPANRTFKRLLLDHAFEAMGVLRVEIKTDILNNRSQRAIEGLGATREGVLRQHMPRPDGTQRDTVMYSIIAPEWPQVRAALLNR